MHQLGSMEDLPRLVEEFSLQVEQQARLPPEQLQALQHDLEWRRIRAEQWLRRSLGTSRAGFAPAVGVIFIGVYAGIQEFLGMRALWWMLAGVLALQQCLTFYVMHVRDQLERDLQLVEFARRRQANPGE